MKNIISISFLFYSIVFNAQIGFEDHQILGMENATFGANSAKPSDIDGDGDFDIVISAEGEDKVSWYENLDGLGTFGSQHIISLTTLKVKDVFSIDIDDDGDMDVLSASEVDGVIAWFENLDGLGTFGDKIIITDTFDGASSVFSADIDGDGDSDVIGASRDDDSIAWYENVDGQGNFVLGQVLTIAANWASDVEAGDIDGDGDMDIIAASSLDNTIGWYENIDGVGTFGAEQILSSDINAATSVHLADIDGDNDLDVLAFSYTDSTIGWFENTDGLGGFGNFQIISNTLIYVASVFAADIDGDNDLDVISGGDQGNGDVFWYENLDGNGTFGTERLVNIDENALFPSSVYAEDLDGDGDNEIIYTAENDGTITYHRNLDGNGNFGLQEVINNYARGPRFLVLKDIDGDNDLDIISLSYQDSRIAWYENLDGLGTFGDQQKISNKVRFATWLHLNDIDGDGDDDIIVTGEIGSELSWFEHLDGQGTFGDEVFISEFAGDSVYSGDVDGDGDIDIVASDNVFKLGYYENLDGLGTFAPRVGIGYATDNISLADIDGDEDLDVIAIDKINDIIIWVENTDGLGAFGEENVVSTEFVSPNSVQAVDIDNDNDLDLLVASQFDNKIAWFENIDGLGNFSDVNIIDTSGEGALYTTTADIDVDGDLDVIATYFLSDEIVWFENLDGNGTFGSRTVIVNEYDYARYVVTGDINGDAVPDIVACAPVIDNITWFQNLGDLENSIYGTIKLDLNANGCDPNDFPMSQFMVTTNDGLIDFATFTQENGSYLINTNEGIFETSITSSLPNYYESNPLSQISDLSSPGVSDEANFCLETTESIQDLSISIFSVDEARPGFEANYQVIFRNYGTLISDGSIDVTFPDDSIDFISASEQVTSQQPNILTFDFVALNPYEVRVIELTFFINEPPVTELDDVLYFTAQINPIAGDFNVVDNDAALSQIVVDSFDPNDIVVVEGAEILIEEANDYLHYIIRFQNTGTAEAINVRVTNELDANLDWTTMQLENVSHPNRVEITDGTFVEFIFDDINLPDINTNEPESHGYIAYKIKPIPSIGLGDVMSNNASIFFDFNAPILTNTVTTTIVETLGIEESLIHTVKVYPIPTEDSLIINSSTKILEATIYNQLGQKILYFSSDSNLETISISSLSNGLYTLTLVDEFDASIVKKIIKN